MIADRTAPRALLSRRPRFQTGTGKHFKVWTVPRKRRISHTYLRQLSGNTLFQILSYGSLCHGTKWLP
jgi:hypothetical protein